MEKLRQMIWILKTDQMSWTRVAKDFLEPEFSLSAMLLEASCNNDVHERGYTLSK